MARTNNVSSMELQRLLERCWTIQDVGQVFKVCGMTIHNWRAHKGLPTVVIPGDNRPALRFVPKEVLAWAKENNVKVHQEQVVRKKNAVG